MKKVSLLRPFFLKIKEWQSNYILAVYRPDGYSVGA